ncbi:PHP domain-like protein [Mytilinidion resinicola]|uniref:PHP domain-like protein n=1 Tax=Mytilinidion resinicola TaxID=574789 RepID=A0A6A6YI97_9PEZI|nr:PHP domain-like protein [Mytilinidion resinicola]KAF2808572.1 PHP domain-like protein [Mytilinidion resinicola]
MFYDLNVPWTASDRELQRTVAFLDELGYDVVALTHTLSGKLPADLTCPIPTTLPFPTPSRLRFLRRCTLILADPSQNHRISQLSAAYDILAIRPTDERTLKQACESLDCDLISLDLTQRLGFHFKFKMLGQAIERGVRFEICYAPGILAVDGAARRNLIGNVVGLIRATRGGRGLVISSEAKTALAYRAPSDVINLASVWGLGQERGKDAVCKEARGVTVTAQLKRTSYRGVVDVVYGGEKPEQVTKAPALSKAERAEAQKKRKADAMNSNGGSLAGNSPKPVPKRDFKRQEKKAKTEGQVEVAPTKDAASGTKVNGVTNNMPIRMED